MQMNNGLTIEQVMECLNCSKGYIYKLIKRDELKAIEGTYPIRIEVDSIIKKIKRLYPWIVDSCIVSLHYALKELELKFSFR